MSDESKATEATPGQTMEALLTMRDRQDAAAAARDGAEYRVEFSITRRLPDEDDFTEVGFGSSGAWDSIDAADHAASSAIGCREWETTEGMPEPEDA